MPIHSRGAMDAIVEHLDYVKPENEVDAMDTAGDSLREYIDNGLIYSGDVLELWNGDTNENVLMEDYSNLMDAVTASTYYQLCEDWDWTVYDGMDAWLDIARPDNIPNAFWGEMSRDDRFRYISDPKSFDWVDWVNA